MLVTVSQAYSPRQGEIGLLPLTRYNFDCPIEEACLNKFYVIVVGAVILLIATAACGSIPFISDNQATETPTRRAPRPTFTPKARATPTEEVQPTEEALPTDEPQATAEIAKTAEPATETPAPTKRPVKSQPKATQPPAPPPPPPAPAFAIKVTSNYLCKQDGVYKLIISAKSGSSYMADTWFGIFDQGGRLLQDGAGKNLVGITQGDANISIGSNCLAGADRVHPNTSNAELDVGDAIRAGNNPVVLRFIKSADDLTPLSQNILLNFEQGGQYWVYTNTK